MHWHLLTLAFSPSHNSSQDLFVEIMGTATSTILEANNNDYIDEKVSHRGQNHLYQYSLTLLPSCTDQVKEFLANANQEAEEEQLTAERNER